MANTRSNLTETEATNIAMQQIDFRRAAVATILANSIPVIDVAAIVLAYSDPRSTTALIALFHLTKQAQTFTQEEDECLEKLNQGLQAVKNNSFDVLMADQHFDTLEEANFSVQELTVRNGTEFMIAITSEPDLRTEAHKPDYIYRFYLPSSRGLGYFFKDKPLEVFSEKASQPKEYKRISLSQ